MLTTAAIIAVLMLVSGCQKKADEPSAAQATATSQQQPQVSPQASPASPAHPAVTPSPSASASPAPAPPARSAAAGTGAKSAEPLTARQAGGPPAKQAKAPANPILLTGAPMGGVRFEHSKHPLDCDRCHHPARQPKPGAAPQAACSACHTTPPQPGMKTGKQAAFHNPTAAAGTCIDCHKRSGGNAPTKCLQCHKKENA